jgi:hypothetical protein
MPADQHVRQVQVSSQQYRPCPQSWGPARPGRLRSARQVAGEKRDAVPPDRYLRWGKAGLPGLGVADHRGSEISFPALRVEEIHRRGVLDVGAGIGCLDGDAVVTPYRPQRAGRPRAGTAPTLRPAPTAHPASRAAEPGETAPGPEAPGVWAAQPGGKQPAASGHAGPPPAPTPVLTRPSAVLERCSGARAGWFSKTHER